MDLYLDFDHNSGRRRRGRRRGRRNRSRVPFVIGVIILLVVIVAGGIFAGRKYMAYRQQKAEEARKLAEARRVVTVMIPEGYSIDMIAKRLEKQGVFKADEFIKAAKNTNQYKNDFIKDIDPKKGTKYKLEGYNVPEGRVKPWGTAHAVLCAKPFINEPFAVINADDYYGVDGYKVMADFLTSHEEKDGKAPFAMVGYHLGNTVTENGYVSRGVCEVDDNHQLLSITERTHIEKREDHAEFTEDDGATWASLPFDTLVSMNFFGFQPMIMDELEKGFPAFLDQAIKENPLKGEYFIPSVASDLLHDGKASLEVLVSKDQWYGVTYPEDKQSVIDALSALRENGTYKF